MQNLIRNTTTGLLNATRTYFQNLQTTKFKQAIYPLLVSPPVSKDNIINYQDKKKLQTPNIY